MPLRMCQVISRETGRRPVPNGESDRIDGRSRPRRKPGIGTAEDTEISGVMATKSHEKSQKVEGTANPVSGLEKPSAGFLWPDTIRITP